MLVLLNNILNNIQQCFTFYRKSQKRTNLTKNVGKEIELARKFYWAQNFNRFINLSNHSSSLLN